MQEIDVAKRYSIDRGTVQVIQQLISIVSHMVRLTAVMPRFNYIILSPLQVTIFARNMGFWALESIFAVFSERVRGGTHADLNQLTKIKLVSSKRARALYSSGFTTIESVAAADPNLLAKCLRCKAGMQPSGIARDIISHAKRLVLTSIRECQSDAARMATLVGR
jgi:replicative superfamily II helicase